MHEIAADITELVRNPIRTGIQRVVRELLRGWPAGGPRLRPVRVHEGALVGVPPAACRLLLHETGLTVNAVRRAVAAAAVPGPPIGPDVPVLIPEVFFDAERAGLHLARTAAGGRLLLIAYDFLPFVEPGLFALRDTLPHMPYIRIVRAAHSVAAISAHTAEDYVTRIMHGDRRRLGPVLPLGADGLGLERQAWHPDRRAFVGLGSLDGRKGQHMVLAAFERLWRAGHPAPLVLIGRALSHVETGWAEAAQSAWPQFRWVRDATDDAVAAELRRARATIYASTAEGYGLPPVESLACGIPVIAAPTLPSLSARPLPGVWPLQQVDVDAVAGAVVALGDDTVAAGLWERAGTATLDRWSGFAAAAAAWVAGQ